ncbi:MAG: recombination-associated protein RdgC [Pseudomonadota bacterium]|uniref:Recombination-associated protein RdgC n=1 Tax=Arenimonas soli TaxID=2269504 RepID=A0ABQ1HLC8_9GAMM|nr:recombination-associated protein RdgC [Arenimonas soli]GGA82253.1 recombination-associated protein RdgC [Arenimonas soli]
MFFRNLTFFRFPTTLAKTLDDLDARLEECKLKPVGPSELMSRGFISPFGRDGATMSHRVGDAIWITLGGEDRLLPSAVINDQLGRKLAEIEEKEGRRLGGRARKRLKEDIVLELLPRAFVRPVRCSATLDLEHGFIAVDTSSRKTAENLVSELRHALGSFPALPLNAEASVRVILTGWLAGEPLPPGLSLGDECELKDPVDGGAVVRCSRHELQVDEIRQHLEAGKQVTRLALVLDDHVGFVLGEDLVLRKLKFLDGAVDQLEGTEADGVAAELDARFALMSGELKRLFAVLEPALKFSRADA